MKITRIKQVLAKLIQKITEEPIDSKELAEANNQAPPFQDAVDEVSLLSAVRLLLRSFGLRKSKAARTRLKFLTSHLELSKLSVRLLHLGLNQALEM